MRSVLCALALLAPIAAPLAASAPAGATATIIAAQDAGDAASDAASGVPACMLVRGEARYIVAGYRHVVVLTNGCSKPAHCSVATSVNPTAQTVDVKSGTTAEVVTFQESPASTFVPFVTCALTSAAR